jgi:hypothetical protein
VWNIGGGGRGKKRMIMSLHGRLCRPLDKIFALNIDYCQLLTMTIMTALERLPVERHDTGSYLFEDTIASSTWTINCRNFRYDVSCGIRTDRKKTFRCSFVFSFQQLPLMIFFAIEDLLKGLLVRGIEN